MDVQPPPVPYEVRIQRVDAERCVVTFLDAARPASAARRLALEERLVCRAVVYLSGLARQLRAEATYRRPVDRLDTSADDFPREALALARGFLYA